ncbi:transcription factor grauzone-like [Anopheles ziemanni]|uniref:transcription factor grauzone-like n=1 Tax=Anopheles ziemanni TaxID=345580 RepID=UPI00265DB063|nr:transcription factor grauzone-like [Anopheles ziemanni]
MQSKKYHMKGSKKQSILCLRLRASMREHMRETHSSDKIVICEICGKQFRSKKNLKQHMEAYHICHVECRYCCSICQKQFKHGKSYKEHMAAHTGITLYECDVCGHGFNSNANMYAHRKRKHPVEWKEKKTKRLISKQINNELSV